MGDAASRVSRVWADYERQQQQHQSARIVFYFVQSPSPDPPFGRLLTWRPKREVGSLGPLDWPAGERGCLVLMSWCGCLQLSVVAPRVRHVRSGRGLARGVGRKGGVRGVSYRSE